MIHNLQKMRFRTLNKTRIHKNRGGEKGILKAKVIAYQEEVGKMNDWINEMEDIQVSTPSLKSFEGAETTSNYWKLRLLKFVWQKWGK